jgi:hypothetical protein
MSLMIAADIKISLDEKPTGTLVTHILCVRSNVVTGVTTVLSAIIIPVGIGVLLTAGVAVMLPSVIVHP